MDHEYGYEAWEDDPYYDPPETKEERKKRRKEERKKRRRDKVIQEVIDTLRSNSAYGSCHGCTNVLNDAANFLVGHYKVGSRENSQADRDHPITTVVEMLLSVGPGAGFVSIIDKEGQSKTAMITYISEDGKKLHVLES